MSTAPRSRRCFVATALAALVLAGCGDDTASDSTTSAPASSTSAAVAGPSVPSTPGNCVAVSDPIPAGSPEVPVKVGPAPTTLIVEDLTVGTGADVVAASTVTVDYIGVSCSTGKIFETSFGREPATFALSEVIQGWSKGLVGMKAGGRRLLGIPSELAYGEAGKPPKIGQNEALWFVVDVRSVS